MGYGGGWGGRFDSPGSACRLRWGSYVERVWPSVPSVLLPGAQTPEFRMAVRITILFDNTVATAGLEKGWGFSCLVEHGDRAVLFDTGWDGDQVLANAERLGLDLSGVQDVVISHEHWDHAGGLPRLLRVLDSPRVWLPAAVSRRLQGDLARRTELMAVSSQPARIAPGLHSTGALGQKPAEQALVVGVRDGVVLVTGCAHPGLERLVEVARSHGPLRGVVGGFHDFDQYHVLAAIPWLVPCHCTQHREEIRRHHPDATRPGGAGLRLDWSAPGS